MKNILLLLLAFTLTFSVDAQIETPALSPAAKVKQTVGLTKVAVEYSRPNMRGRTIFGGLVPYDKMWRTGANARTKITFGNDVTIGGQEVKAGTYAIFTKPSEKSWEVYFYTEHEGGGVPQEWDDSKVAAKVTADVMPLPMSIESFTMTFDDLTSDSAVLGMLWENAYVGVKFEVPTDSQVMSAIESTMKGPGFGDYYAAAGYFLAEGKDPKQAKEWIDKAMSMNDNPRFWQLRQQSLIYAAAGDKNGAIELAKKSMAAAQEAGNDQYVKMNKESLKEWGAM